MKYIQNTKIFRSLATLAVLAFSSNAIAAGPLAVCSNGEPFRWADGGANVPFNPDQGNLGLLDSATATQAVTDAFGAWAAVPTATINYANAGQLPVDVDVTNFLPYLQPVAPDGLSAIVFDDTGEIFELLYGPGSGVLGFAGPEWINGADCTIFEGVSFLNGPAIASLEGLLDLMVHEFGHYSNLAHTEVNGQLWIGVGDTSGPGSSAYFGNPPFPDAAGGTNPDGDYIATMYPFLFGGIDQSSRTPAADDIASLSQIYPTADFAASTGSISGTILLGSSKVTGVNVIARNVADPFVDAVSGISSDFTEDFSQGNPYAGLYTLRNLTPGADYAVYIDEILAGGFSTPLQTPLPGPEEFYNGVNESGDSLTDDPLDLETVAAVAGAPVEGIDILFNVPPPGLPLPISDDGTVQIPLPFQFCAAGKAYDSAYINGNGFITLGAGGGLGFAENVAEFLGGPPRIAGFWDDLNVDDGGSVYYEQTDSTFKVTWEGLPEFGLGGSNTFSVKLYDNSRACASGANGSGGDDEHGSWGGGSGHGGHYYGKAVKITHGEISSLDGLVGVSAGAFATSGFEAETDLSAQSRGGRRSLTMFFETAVYEQFSGEDVVDLADSRLSFKHLGREHRDRFERNDSIERAAKVRLPFDTINTFFTYSSISPSANDVDYYQFRKPLEAGTTLVAEALTGQIDTVFGLYRCDTVSSGHGWWQRHSQRCDPESAVLVAANDDSNGLLSKIVYEVPEDGTYVLAVTFCCDYDFDGIDPGQGDPLDHGRYVLDVYVVDGVLIELTDESFAEFPLGFDFPYQGSIYDSVFVNSNGYLTFGDGDFGGSLPPFLPNIDDFEGGLPRIAPLWVDLDPGAEGMIVANSDGNTATINFVGVPEFFFGGSNSFSVTLDASGNVALGYAGMTAPEGITGLSEGGGAPATLVDFSSSSSWPATGSTVEEFLFGISELDLDGSVLTFEP